MSHSTMQQASVMPTTQEQAEEAISNYLKPMLGRPTDEDLALEVNRLRQKLLTEWQPTPLDETRKDALMAAMWAAYCRLTGDQFQMAERLASQLIASFMSAIAHGTAEFRDNRLVFPPGEKVMELANSVARVGRRLRDAGVGVPSNQLTATEVQYFRSLQNQAVMQLDNDLWQKMANAVSTQKDDTQNENTPPSGA